MPTEIFACLSSITICLTEQFNEYPSCLTAEDSGRESMREKGRVIGAFDPCDIQSVSFVVVCLFLDLRRMSYKKTLPGRAVV